MMLSQKVNNNSISIAYASSEQTLEDYLKSDICCGREIYCAFDCSDFKYHQESLKVRMQKIGITRISFKNRFFICA
jgi:adenylate cyclase class IV